MLSNCESVVHLFMVIVVWCFIDYADCQQLKPSTKRLLPWTPGQVSNPWKEPSKCGRFLPAFVCNPDRYFEDSQVSTIDQTLWNYGRSGPCLCDRCLFADLGITIGLALLEDVDVRSAYSNSDQRYEEKPTLQQFTDSIRKSWRLGTCDNDVILVITSLGGAISFGEVSKQILAKSKVSKLTEADFPKSQDEQLKFLYDIFREIHSHDLIGLDKKKLFQRVNEARNLTQSDIDVGTTSPLVSGLTLQSVATIDREINDKVPWTTQNDTIITTTTTTTNITTVRPKGIWLGNTFVAAPEDDEFEKAERKKVMSTSLAFMIVGSLTVILVSLIALFLIIWYYRTKTGAIEPSTIHIKSKPDEKTPSDIKAVKYEPCKTDEPGLPV